MEIADELAKRGQLKPEFANTTEECTDTSKLYVLPDGYIYAYMYATTANFTNLADRTSEEWLTDKRINSSGNLVDVRGVDITNYIPNSTSVQKIYIKGLDVLSALATGENYGRIYAYNTDKTYIEYRQPSAIPTYFSTADDDSSVTIFDMEAARSTSSMSVVTANAYLRFGGIPTEDEIIITVDEPITYSTDYIWQNTGHAFVPADYEDRIVTLESKTESQEERLTTLENTQSRQENSTLPEYWQDAVDEAVSKVKALQDTGGKNVVCFAWLSDLHYSPNDAYTRNIGHLCVSMMDRCDMPYTLLTGDTMSAAVVDSEATLLNYLEGAADLLSPIGSGRLLQLRGNHDDVWGSYTQDGNTAYYVNKADSGKVWNRIGRRQALDTKHVFGGDGSYFYADILAQKVRFVCLNTHYYDGAATTDGTVKSMSFTFGEEQLEWLKNTALAVDDGWKIILSTHTPITDAIMSANEVTDRETFKTIITAAQSRILGAFCGHIHRDMIYEGTYSFPIMTITCAANSSYDSSEETRVAGTTTETAVDVVCINRKTGAINTVRLGVGSDRSFTD